MNNRVWARLSQVVLGGVILGAGYSASADEVPVCSSTPNDYDKANWPTTAPLGQCVSNMATCWVGPTWATGQTYSFGEASTCNNAGAIGKYYGVRSIGNLANKAAAIGADTFFSRIFVYNGNTYLGVYNTVEGSTAWKTGGAPSNATRLEVDSYVIYD